MPVIQFLARFRTQEDSEQQRQREHRFWQSRLADLVTCMRQRGDNPVTVEETEAMDAVELLDLSQVGFVTCKYITVIIHAQSR